MDAGYSSVVAFIATVWQAELLNSVAIYTEVKQPIKPKRLIWHEELSFHAIVEAGKLLVG